VREEGRRRKRGVCKSRVEGMTWMRRGGKRGGTYVCHIRHTITTNNNIKRKAP